MSRTTHAIALQGAVRCIGENLFSVQSESDPSRWYVVTLPNGSCSCPDFMFRQTDCKHIQACRFYAWRSGS